MFIFSSVGFSFMFSLFFIFPLALMQTFPPDYLNPLLVFDNQVKEVHLYTDNHRSNLFLTINPDGKVTGSDAQSQNSVLQLKSIRRGQVVIRAKSTSRFLCMDSSGNLRGELVYLESECTFREQLTDGYSRYLSLNSDMPVSLASDRHRDREVLPFSQFLPLANTLPEEGVSVDTTPKPIIFDWESEDVFGIKDKPVVSPENTED